VRATRSIRFTAAAASAALLLAACGGDDTDTATDTTAETETTDEDMTDDGTADEDVTDEDVTDDGMADDGAMEDEDATEGEAAALPAGQFGPACDAIPADGPGSAEGMAEEPAATAASNNPVLSTLVELVGAANLVDTINGLDGATIFAPSNEAFEQFQQDDPETFDAVANDPEGLLTTVLTYHVVGDQELDAQALADAGTATTVAEQDLTVSVDGETVTVEAAGSEATVVCGNVETANATVHIIDYVLVPDVG
jgi:transforming growth factor-beta-induced protein